MISVCTVIKGYSAEYLDEFTKSLYHHCKHIKEIIVYNVNDNHLPLESIPFGMEYLYHAIGLFDCIQKANQEYVLLSDPDILVLSSIDELYLDLMHKHDLTCIGVAHHSPELQPYLHMPVVFNMLMKKNQLPPQNFMENEYTDCGHPRKKLINGNWLLPGKTEKYVYPNPNPTIWDTGNKLYLHLKNKRWLSFLTQDSHLYTTNQIKTNFNFDAKINQQKLLFHEGSSSFKPFANSLIKQQTSR